MKRILIIDDERGIRETLTDLLLFEDYEVNSAENGRLGIAKALETTPDLIICDVMMPEMNGFETLQALRQVKKLAYVPFIFLTAKAEKSDLREGMNLGADDFITKPFSSKELLQVVKLRLEKAERSSREYQQQINNLKESINRQNQRIKEYSSINSHDLRGPVATMLGLINMMIEEQSRYEDRLNAPMLQMLDTTCKQLDAIVMRINNILEEEELKEE